MTPRFAPACAWAGSRLLLALLAGTAVGAQPVETTAGIRIGLPGRSPRVAVAPGPERVELELPRGAELPRDFGAASNGMLSAGVVDERGERLFVTLELDRGYLDHIAFEPDALVLRFRSRGSVATAPEPEAERYALGAEDRLRVTIHNQPGLSGSLVVGGDGMITVPLVGELRAAGLTPRQLAARLTEAFDRTYLVDPRVDVEVEEYRSQWVMVGGEVRRPGRVPLRGGTRLKEVIGEVQGFTEYAGDQIAISRTIDAGGESVVLRVGREEFESGLKNPSLAAGDIVDVPRAVDCYVQGEVREAGPVRIERGMTLMRAISLAGGLTEWANRKSVTVLQPDRTLQVYNLARIAAGKEDDPRLRGGELIIVKRRFL